MVGFTVYNDDVTGLKSGSTKRLLEGEPNMDGPFNNESIVFMFWSTAALTFIASGSTNSQSYSTSKRAPLVESTRLTVPRFALPFGGINPVKDKLVTAFPAPSTAAKFTEPEKFMVKRTTLGAVLVNSYTKAKGSLIFVVYKVISSEMIDFVFSSLGFVSLVFAGRDTANNLAFVLPDSKPKLAIFFCHFTWSNINERGIEDKLATITVWLGCVLLAKRSTQRIILHWNSNPMAELLLEKTETLVVEGIRWACDCNERTEAK